MVPGAGIEPALSKPTGFDNSVIRREGFTLELAMNRFFEIY